MTRTMLLSAGLVLLVACGGAGNLAGAIDDAIDDSVFSLAVGTCFDDAGLEDEEIYSVDDLSCDTPHDNEVFALFDLTGSEFPGDLVLDLASDGCVERFDAYVGIAYFESDLDVFPIYPTAESWDAGDREVVCALYALDLSKLTGSMQGSRR